MLTISVIKADVGGYVGHSSMHPELIATAEEKLAQAKQGGTLVDYHVAHCGDDLFLIMTHERGVNDEEVHRLAWDTFLAGTEVAKKLKLYGAGQDLLSDAFSGNIRGMGPGSAEMEIEERTSEPILVFMGDKTSAGSFNLPLYKMFADPFNTAGLIIAESLHQGFTFEVHDVINHQKINFECPEELYDMLVFLGSPSRFCVKAVYSRNTGEIGAVSSTDKLALIAGRYVGKDDPTCVVRSQGVFPAVGEVLEPFTFPAIVEGWMRGSHQGPWMPCSVKDANPSRFDGPPRVAALGFQVANGKLIGPRDMFDDPGFDEARHQANLVADYLRRHGPWEPHRLPLEEMEYTTMPAVA
ncbi:MAG: fructose-1,6-bisphosphate aldolase/phosphatase, partial [Dehalococcoidia bacterium]|nr:fructose-1,6-bisphosphate aldolase/phosphatase [Dehalococcoidia bacterium]